MEQAWIPSYFQAMQVQQNNELKGNTTGGASEFYCNPLVLNGKFLDYNKFTISSKGTLSVVKGNPNDVKAEKVPFRVMIRREGKLITVIDFSGKGLYEVEISKVLASAKAGDQLIIDPVNPKDWKAKRILKLLDTNC
ncbi:MAG TPA: hypothetical protein VFE57_04685 [Cyclobacteriaceae bacterium]|nr:hypothetical protein [Cyclobacteriaceae bacterium]